MSPLPPLTERIDRGAAGGLEFERLMSQLLLRHADRHGYVYEPTHGAGGDRGVDGLAPEGGVPGLDGPVAFQFKWLWGDVHKGTSAQQLKRWWESVRGHPRIPQWILVTPEDLKESERTWLEELVADGPKVYHWGRERVEQLLLECPALFARYYPERARLDPRPELAGYDGSDFRELAAAYRKQVALVHENIRTLGLPPETLRERDAQRSIPLRRIFVPLTLLPSGEGDRKETLAEVLRSGGSRVVLGDPGSGKSTLLTFLALLYAGEAELEGFVPPEGFVPLLVPLRDFVRLQKEKPGLSLLAYFETRARSDLSLAGAHQVFFESALRMGEAVVLLDGIDEVGKATSRRRLADTIRTFRASYPDCPLWVTSRVYGYTGDTRLPEDAFRHARLGRLEEDQVDDFIDRWYALQPNEREREERAKSLRRAVRRTPSVEQLAGNPLLLTLMAFIHQGLRRLPQDRGELYEKCVEMLLKTWQDAKREDDDSSGHPFEALGLHLNTQKDYLAHLALYVQERGGGEDGEARGLVTRREALDVLVGRHLAVVRRTDPQITDDRARAEMEDFLDYVSDRTGLLIDRGGDQLSFIHLSFQEYLTAWIFTCERTKVDVGFFRRHLGDPVWEEVLLLRLYIILRTPGGGGAEDFDRVVKALLRRLKWREKLPAFLQGNDGEIRAGWLTLARALRDNLDFQPDDETSILRRALGFWWEQPAFEGEWFRVLEEVRLFKSRSQEKLESLLHEALASSPPRAAVASLHLATKLFGFPSGTVRQLEQRPDLETLLPDLGVFVERPGVADLLGRKSNLAVWSTTFRALEISLEISLYLKFRECSKRSVSTWSRPDGRSGWRKLWKATRTS